MVKRRRSSESGSGGTTTDAGRYNTVFIDTSIDTHFALVTDDSDTVSHLKDKIVLEHGRCFPELGLVNIRALKVKRKESFYHLPDYMFVKCAFEGVNESWFLYVDISKCNDVSQIVKHDASNQMALLTSTLHDQDHLRGDCFKIPCDSHEVGDTDIQNESSLKHGCNIPATTQEFKDDNVRNVASYSSGQSGETCNSAKRHKRKHDPLQATSASKDNKIPPQAHRNKLHFETGNTTVNTQNNKANKLPGSPVESEPQRDGQELSSSHVTKSKKSRKGSLRMHEPVHSSLSSPKHVEVNECILQNAESEKGCSSSGKDNVAAPASICSPVIPNSTQINVPKMDHMDNTADTNLLALHDREVNCTEELNPSQNGLEKPGKSTLPSTLSDTKEVNGNLKRSKKRVKSSKSKLLEAHVDQVRNLTADSHVVLPDINGQELPESAESKNGRLVSGNHDVTELGDLGSLYIHHSLHDDMLKIDNTNKTEERNLSAVHDPESEMRQTEEHDLLHRKSTVPSAFLVTKEAKTHESSRKKRSQISGSGVQDEHVDRSTDSNADFGLLLPNVAASDHQVCESSAAKAIFSSEADDRAVERNLSTKIVDTDEATEGQNRGGKKKKKVKKSDASVKDPLHRESIVAENDLNLKQVPRTKLSNNLEGPDVLKDIEVDKAIKDGKAVCEEKKKQKVEKGVARVQETVDTNREADQNIDIVSPPLDSPDPGVNHGGKEKKKKVKKSGAVAKDQQNRDSIVAEIYLNLKQVPETELPSNSKCIDVIAAFEVNEKPVDGKAIGKKKKKRAVEKSVAIVQERGDMDRDVDQIKDIVSPSLDNPGNLLPISEKDEICQKVEERDLLVNKNLEEMVLPSDRPSYRDENEPVVETVCNSNTSTAIVADEQKMSGTKTKKRARKTVSGACQDGMDTENTKTRTRASSSELDRHADLQVEKDKDLLPIPKGIEASAKKSSDTSRDKITSPMQSPQKDGEASECIGKEIDFKQYFVSSQHQDEVSREPIAGTVAKKKREEVVPSLVSAPKLQQDFPKSTKKDSKISSAGKANTLTESKRVTKTEKKNGKRGVPYVTASSDLDEIRTPRKPVSSTFLNGSDATKTMPNKKETVKSLASSGVNSSYKTPLKSNTRDIKESSFRHHVPAGKNTSSKLDGEIVNKSKQMKGLRKTPKPIFRDVSSESSLDENGSVGSTASTRTPSDNLSSSSELSDDATGNGRDDKDKGGSNKTNSNLENSGERLISLDTILKSSSRFKKAKLTASQQFEDPDSQFDDLLRETQL